MLYPQKGSIAKGSRRTTPTLPAAAAVVSLPSVAPKKTPFIQLNACMTSGIVVARRPPKTIALMGTPSGSSANLLSAGLFTAGAVKREFGCAALSGDPFFHGLPSQSVTSSGTSPSSPSHQTPPSLVCATFVKIVSCDTVFIAFGLVVALVPGATPKYPFSGFTA